VLILSGRATLTPNDGSAQIHVQAGDAIYFHNGFACRWAVHEPILKHYGYFDEAGEETKPAQIACDACGAECYEESFLCGSQDLCPSCYAAGGKKRYKNAGALCECDSMCICTCMYT